MKINELLIPYYTYDERKYNGKRLDQHEIEKIKANEAINEIIYNDLGVLLYERYKEYIDEYISEVYGDYSEGIINTDIIITDPDELKAFSAFEGVDNLANE